MKPKLRSTRIAALPMISGRSGLLRLFRPGAQAGDRLALDLVRIAAEQGDGAAVAAGHHVTLACATRGEVGEISMPGLATPDTLGKVREAELRAAAGTYLVLIL